MSRTRTLSHRDAAELPQRVVNRLGQARSGAAGTHADQNRRRGGKAARGGRQGERTQLRRETFRGEF